MRTYAGLAALCLILAACGAAPAPEAAAIAEAPAPQDAAMAGREETAPHPVHIRGSQELTIDSALLGRTYPVRVMLPPGYDDPENAGRLYPVLYLNDGPMNSLVATGILSLPMGQGIIEELIVVGIGYSAGTSSTDSRARDYTPVVNPSAPRETGRAGEYLAFLEQEVLPLIETSFRADPRRRALGGHSYGGLFAAYALLTKPELFQHYLISSPSFWFGDNAMWDIEAAYAAAHDDLAAKVYVAIGSLERPGIPGGSDYDMVEDVRMFERLLAGRAYPGLELRASVIEGQNHETAIQVAFLNGVLWHFNARRDIPFGY